MRSNRSNSRLHVSSHAKGRSTRMREGSVIKIAQRIAVCRRVQRETWGDVQSNLPGTHSVRTISSTPPWMPSTTSSAKAPGEDAGKNRPCRALHQSRVSGKDTKATASHRLLWRLLYQKSLRELLVQILSNNRMPLDVW